MVNGRMSADADKRAGVRGVDSLGGRAVVEHPPRNERPEGSDLNHWECPGWSMPNARPFRMTERRINLLP